MTLPKLWQIAKDRFTNEQIQDIWDNRKTIELIDPLDFLKLNYTKFGFEFAKGQISSTGISFEFKKKNYDLTVCRFYSNYKREFYDSVLLIPHYTTKHFDSYKNKTIKQSAKDIHKEEDFIKLQKTIAKRFPF